MPTHPMFKEQEPALKSALELAQATGTKKFVVYLQGHFCLRSNHTPGPLATRYFEVYPNGYVFESF